MLLHHLPLARPAYMDLPRRHWTWPSSPPTAGRAASVGWPVRLGLSAWGWVSRFSALEPKSVECSSLGGVLPALWPGVTSLIPTHGAQAQCSSPEALSPGARCYLLSFVRAFVRRGKALHHWETGTLATWHLWQAFRGDEEIWWGWQKILRADYSSQWNQECLAHLLVYFEEPSKCQFSSGFT